MNQKLYVLCANFPDELRKEDWCAFFKSIHGTLNHLLFGDHRWMERFMGKPFAGHIVEELYVNFDELRYERVTPLMISSYATNPKSGGSYSQ